MPRKATTLQTTQTTESVEPQPAPAADTALFDWQRQWYPIIPIENLEPSKPYPFHLLGQQYVIWSSADGQWSCFLDKCPHRLAPLSEGRIDPGSGHLQCSYHGWSFDASGACSNIPQISDPKALATACGSSRSCVRSLTTRQLHGILWVWPDGSPEGAAVAQGAIPTGIIPELEEPSSGAAIRGNWYHRDLPISYDVLLENLLDPTHVPFAHHGVISNRKYEQGTTIQLQAPLQLSGYTVDVQDQGPRSLKYSVKFSPPCHVKYDLSFGGVLLYAVPTRPGWSRAFVADKQVSVPGSKSVLPLPVRLFLQLAGRYPFLQHITARGGVLDGDTYFLHVQERYLKGSEDSWRQQYYMPWSSDSPVVAFRQWVDRFAGEIPGCAMSAGQLPAELPKEAVLDRWGQHTRECRACRQALERVECGVGISQAVALVAAAAAVALLVAQQWQGLAAAGGVALVAAAAAWVHSVLVKLRRKFYYEPYDHSTKH